MKILFFIVCFTTSAYGDETYRLGRSMLSMKSVDGILVNLSCEDKKCEAYKKSLEFRSQTIFEGGRNPFAVKCKKLMKGEVMIAVDLDGNEMSLCSFKDGSFLGP
jgi:hypothetical protein